MERYRSFQKVFSSRNSFGSPCRRENLRMHTNDQDFLIVRAIEDANPPAFGKPARGTPEKVMLQFFGARLFETENLAAFRIDPGHDVADGAILAGSVQGLKNQQQCIAAGRVVKLLQRAQFLNVFFQEFPIPLLRLAKGLYQRRPLMEFYLFSGSAHGNPWN
jgi:hypothetical protein